MYRTYEPGIDHPWIPLNSAVVPLPHPEIGILVPADPSGKDPGAYIQTTAVPDTASPSGLLSQDGECGVLVGYAGKVDSLGEMGEFRGFGKYTIHAESLTNAQAMANPCPKGSGVPADVSFTIAAVPTLATPFTPMIRSVVDDFHSVQDGPGGFRNSEAVMDMICALHAKVAADGTLTGIALFKVDKTLAILETSFPRPARGRASRATRSTAPSTIPCSRAPGGRSSPSTCTTRSARRSGRRPWATSTTPSTASSRTSRRQAARST